MMMYSRSMIVLTLLVSIIGLARPSDDGEAVTTRKLAKGSKKNPPPSPNVDDTAFKFREDVLISMVVPKAMASLDMEDAVTKIVRNILTGHQQNNNSDRDLAESIVTNNNDISNTRVEITETTETKCPEQYLAEVVAFIRCYDAIVTINSKEALVDRLLQLTEALDGVISVDDGSIVITKRRGGYAYVRVKNTTPYPVGPPYRGKRSSGYVWYHPSHWCRRDEIPGIAPGDTWSAKSRGICLVVDIAVDLVRPDGEKLKCEDYFGFTSYSQFFIIMKGDNACCVQSSHESGVCP